MKGEPPLPTGRIPEMKEGPPARFNAPEERTPLALAWRTPVVRAERVMVPEEEIPVAAAIDPEALTWKGEPEPTEKREEGEVVPIPTNPLERAVRAGEPLGERVMLPVPSVPSCRVWALEVPRVPAAVREVAPVVPEREAVGVPELTLITAKAAEEVLVPPIRKSWVVFLSKIEPFA